MKEIKPTRVIGRKALREALETVPVDVLFSPSVSQKLTTKQKKFAREVAKGATKAQAYRSAYEVTSKRTMAAEPYRLAANPIVAREIDAYRLAIESAEHRTPVALRELVIQTLAQVLIDPDAKQAVKVQAAKVLGTVTEVAAFTERKEVRTITSSADARETLMAQIKELARSQAVDADVIERDAESLMRELESGQDGPHPPPTPHDGEQESQADTHIDPHEQLASFSDPDPTPSSQEHPPVGDPK